MSPVESSAQRATPEERPGLKARIDELRSLIPELPVDLSETGGDEFSLDLLDLLERKQRHLIQGNVRIAALRDLTETLLRDPEEERVLRTISLYLRQAHGLAEAMVLSRTDDGGLRGYWTRAGAARLCEAVRWSAETLKNTAWATALSGQMVQTSDDLEHPPGTPKPLPLIMPLRTAADSTDDENADYESIPSVGLLAIRPDETTGAGEDPLEVEQLAFQAATLLDSVRQQQRKMADRRFRECVMEAMDDGLLAVDGHERITAANRAALVLLGFEEDSIVGRSLDELKNNSPQIVAVCRECMENDAPLRHQEAWITQGKVRIPVNLSVVPLGEAMENGGGVVATLTDLRPLRAMEEELRRLDRLAALGRFAAAVAHEIRNPLAAIGAGVDFLGSALGEDKKSDLDLLRNEVARLDRIVADLLEPMQSRPLQKQKVRLSKLAQRACQTVEPLARERRVRFTIRPSIEESFVETVLMADGDRLLQVLVNLVRNAVEASPEDSEVEIGWATEKSDGGAVRQLWVRDRGSGISKEHIEHLFEPFYSAKPGGTGLGLYVCHSVVEQHGGKLQVDSTQGHGTRVTVYLPSP